MAINFPAALDGTAQFSQPVGSSLLTGIDHASQHDNLSSLGTVLQTMLGTNSSSGGILNAFTGADKPARQQGGTFQAVYTGTLNLFGQGTNSGTQQGGVYATALYVGGTHNTGVFGTPSIDVITARVAGIGVGFSNSMYPAQGTLVDSAGGTLTADARASQIYYCAMGTTAGNRTLGTPTNPSNYQQLTYAFKSSGSANGTLVFPSIFRMSQDIGTPLLGTGTSWNYYGFRYNAIDTKWDFVGQSKNII